MSDGFGVVFGIVLFFCSHVFIPHSLPSSPLSILSPSKANNSKHSVAADIAAATSLSSLPTDPIQVLAAIKAKESLAKDLKRSSRITDALKVMKEVKELTDHLEQLKREAAMF